MVQSIWDPQFIATIGVKLGDADAYLYEPMAALLAWWEFKKKTSTVSTVMTNR